MIYGYSRVSTDKQDQDRQRLGILDYARAHKLRVDEVVCETISSRKRDRQIFELIDRLGKGDQLIVVELSRLGRSSVVEIASIVERIRDRGATLHVVNESLIIKPGKMDTRAQMMILMLGIASSLERDLISERTKGALKVIKERGVKLGRPTGARKLEDRKDEIRHYLEKRISKSDIAKLLDVSRATLYRFIDERKLDRIKSAN